jgi:hypothetical protein
MFAAKHNRLRQEPRVCSKMYYKQNEKIDYCYKRGAPMEPFSVY